MRRILIPTDFSENAWNAIDYAMQLFRNKRCTFYLLNTYTPVIPSSRFMANMAEGVRIVDAVRDESERGLQRTVERIQRKYGNPNHSFETISSFNLLVEEVKDIVDTFGIHLVITGTKGASGVDEVFMGSNTYKIIKEIDFCPIIAVPEDFKSDGAIETILLATGYEHLFESYELKPLLQIAKLFGSKIKITHVGSLDELTPEQKTSRNVIKKQLKGVEYDFIGVEKDASINNTIQKMVERDSAVQMVAMINHDRGFFERLTREPVIKKVSFNSRVPFLVIHLFE